MMYELIFLFVESATVIKLFDRFFGLYVVGFISITYTNAIQICHAFIKVTFIEPDKYFIRDLFNFKAIYLSD